MKKNQNHQIELPFEKTLQKVVYMEPTQEILTKTIKTSGKWQEKVEQSSSELSNNHKC
jgi:hypothetical protein